MTTRLAALLALFPTTALAHPGHGHTEPQTWAHYLTEPLHVAVLAGAAVVGTIATVAWRRKHRARG